jgi:hypothetical protein
MCHHIQCFDREQRDHIGKGRLGAGLGVVEGTHASSFVDGHSPTVRVNVRIATSAFEPSDDSCVSLNDGMEGVVFR